MPLKIGPFLKKKIIKFDKKDRTLCCDRQSESYERVYGECGISSHGVVVDSNTTDEVQSTI